MRRQRAEFIMRCRRVLALCVILTIFYLYKHHISKVSRTLALNHVNHYQGVLGRYWPTVVREDSIYLLPLLVSSSTELPQIYIREQWFLLTTIPMNNDALPKTTDANYSLAVQNHCSKAFLPRDVDVLRFCNSSTFPPNDSVVEPGCFSSIYLYVWFYLPVTLVTHAIRTQEAQTFQGPMPTLLKIECNSTASPNHS